MNELSAIGAYIFSGSQTIGHLNTGWKIDTVLEMTEDMTDTNAYHFCKNYPNINIKRPSEWSQNAFLDTLKEKHYNLLYSNNPCSGLSSINKNAKVDNKVNNRFYEVFDIINHLNPDTFLIENAPTVVTLGLPILKDMVNILGEKYKFTIIRDMAGNHGVSMRRLRTMIVGWNKNKYEKIPEIKFVKQNKTTIKEIFEGLTPDTPNMEFDNNRAIKNMEEFYRYVKHNESLMCGLYNNLNNLDIEKIPNEHKKQVKSFIEKKNNGERLWDKSSYRLDFDGVAPSMTSLAQFIHPVENRDLYIREYARIMGYPDDFIFYPNECKIPTIQCLAQGVPVKFIEWISKEIMNTFTNDYNIISDKDVVFQNHTQNKVYEFTLDEFQHVDKLI